MEASGTNFLQRLPASKLFPPRLDPGLHLPRSRVLRYVRERGGTGRKVLLIEAQAGQGKSIFAAQLVEHLGADHCWYQLGPEDGDTLLLVSTLLVGLAERLPGFRAPLLERMLGTGATSAQDHARLCSLLLHELKSFLSKDFYLVLDDVYLLEGCPQSLAFLQGLLDGAPPRLRFILTSRHPIASVVRAMLPAGDSHIVDNAVLAFNRQEIAELFNGILHIPVSQKSVQLLHRLTEGWPLGLILAGQSLPEGVPGAEESLVLELPEMTLGGVLDYFLAQVFPRFSAGLRRTLMLLSLLDNIPVGLAETLADAPDTGELLTSLHRRNFFVRPLDNTCTEFVFHHLFHDSLRALARRHLSPETIRDVHRRAAQWYLQQNRPVEALGHYFAAEEFAAAEQVLKDVGFELQANNRIITLAQALRRIPDEVILRYGWLSYFAGVSTMDVDPPAVLMHLENAHRLFREKGEELGELLTLVRLIAFHVLGDGRHHLGAAYLDRAAALFEQKGEELTPIHRAHASNVFLMAFTTIHNDIPRADAYYALGLKIAREKRLQNLEAEARLWRCYRHIFAGCYPECFAEIEEAAPLLHSPLVNSINKAALYLAFVNALAQTGDQDGYRYHRGRVREMMGGDLVDRSVIGAFMRLWDIGLAFARGDDAQVREILTRALAADLAGAGPHLRSMYLQYQALLLARKGREKECLAAAEESRRLRAEIGCRFFIAYNSLLIGAAHARLGRSREALDLFKEGLEKSEAMGEWFIRGGVHAQRARLYLDLGQTENARKDIREVLEILHRHGYVHFRSWTPELMERILAAAVREGIRADFARDLAARRLGLGILPDGAAIPLLHIRTLGSLEVRSRQRIVLRGGALTPAQRQLLAILLTSPGLQRSQEEIAALLWPESPEDKARKNFDALLIRLRRTLHDASGGEIDSRSYLSLRKGILSLEHCRVDALDFRERAMKGLRHRRKGESWQADNAFRSALGLWQGEFLAGMTLPEPVETFRQDLAALYLECACGWSSLLSSDGRHEEARQVAEAALRHDPIHEDLVRGLYEIHAAQSKPVKARQLLEAYAKALREATFSEEEIEEILEAFWTHPA